jgi:Tudor domain
MFYKNLEESKHLSIRQLLPGMSVAVYDEDMWQRAEVLCICDSEAFILLVDAGCRKYVEARSLRYLEKSFALSSRKSCRGSLVGAKPKNDDTLWSAAAIMKFMAKTKGEKMFAIVKGKKDGFFQLSLVEDPIKRAKISHHLIAEGVAEEDTSAEVSGNAILVS